MSAPHPSGEEALSHTAGAQRAPAKASAGDDPAVGASPGVELVPISHVDLPHIRPTVRTAGVASARVLLLSIPLLLGTRAARAQDPFEIQVYDSETAPPLHAGIELHTNYFARGMAVSGPGPVLPTDRVLHLTFEPHLGLTDWAEMGGYLQTAARPDGTYDYAGAKLRFKARLPQPLTGQFGVALNTELSAIPRAYSESRFGAELRPIVDVRAGRVYLSVNPILDIDFEGDLAGRLQLEPAAKAEVMLLEDHLGLGTEYYAAIGPLTAPLPLSQQVHRIFAVVDLTQVPAGPVRFGFNLGVGYGLAAGEKWIVKSIIGTEMP